MSSKNCIMRPVTKLLALMLPSLGHQYRLGTTAVAAAAQGIGFGNRIGGRKSRSASATTRRVARRAVTTPTPVIGVLSQPGWNSQSHYIAASYIKWLEAGGARSIPIPYDASAQLIDDLYTQINGLFLPGGSCDMPPGLYHLLDRIVKDGKKNDDDDDDDTHYFPVWGTCLGFEFLIQYVGGKDALQDGFDASNISWPLEHVRQQELYSDSTIYNTVTTKSVTMNSHHQGIEPAHFLNGSALTAMWDITSINHDKKQRAFVSTIEPSQPRQHNGATAAAATLPWYGVQYHPEKNAFEYASIPGTNIPYEDIDHSAEGIAFSLHLAAFFVDKVRHGQAVNRKHHDYTKPELYPLVTAYPIQTGLHFEEIFVVPTAAHWNDTERFEIE